MDRPECGAADDLRIQQLGRLNGELVVSTPKTPNSIRTVVIPNRLWICSSRSMKHQIALPVPVAPDGGMFSPDSAGRIHKTLLKKAGIDEGVRFHDLAIPLQHWPSKTAWT